MAWYIQSAEGKSKQNNYDQEYLTQQDYNLDLKEWQNLPNKWVYHHKASHKRNVKQTSFSEKKQQLSVDTELKHITYDNVYRKYAGEVKR